MDIKIKDKKKKEEVVLYLGDVVVVHDDIYLIIKEKDGYIAKSFDGEKGSTGYYHSLRLLQNSLEEYNYTHYDQKDYKLVLERKF